MSATLSTGLFSLVALGILFEAVPAGAGKPIREVVDQGYRVRLDLTGQVLAVSIPQDLGFGSADARAEAPIAPTLQGSLRSGFVSASMLAQKAKQFDDGLYAAVELAAQQGAGRFAGKAALLQAVAQHLAGMEVASDSTVPGIVYGACRLGHVPAREPASLEGSIQSAVSEFLADPVRSKPIGFYTWSGALGSIFQQDRMLRGELKGKAGIDTLVRALHADARARASYESYLAFVSRLTNPLAGSSLKELLSQLDRGQLNAPQKGLAFFPPSRAHETELIKKLYGDRPIPPGFNLADELIARIRAGQISLQPAPESGWYDHQTWALEPLVLPEKAPEASHLRLDDAYRAELIELFKGLIALTRETHIKQLEVPRVGAAAPVANPRVVITIAPELSAEPLVTYYRRRAESYRFVHEVVEQFFGSEALQQMHRLTAEGPVQPTLAQELDQMQALFFGAAGQVGRQLGMQATAEGKRDADADAKAFTRWSGTLASDPDLSRDARMMVPVFYDLKRRKTKVWVFLGWAERPVRISFVKQPSAEVFKDDKPVTAGGPELKFVGTSYTIAYPVTAEVYVTQILDRAEFRKHCDQYKTQSAILKNLR